MVNLRHGTSPEDNSVHVVQHKRRLSRWRDYGSCGADDPGDACPTCQGTGRIPRGQESQLVAVIPCSDRRLKPSHTKVYVCLSVAVCLLISTLVLFFLFPRSVTLSSALVESVLVIFTSGSVQLTITNSINVTNENFVSVHARDLDMQVLLCDTVVGRVTVPNVTKLSPRAQEQLTAAIPVTIKDPGLNAYCKSSAIRIHTVFLHLQLTLTVSCLGHTEQLSLDTFEYVDCGSNSTGPHRV
ncbi:transmembrane protein 106A [Denticeps clupeoides]|uniref:Uncharacterized protein n=1 Tax=Denticeps clupeoides TaxID=299321 RepID=A0AAY4DGB1_9TELE|nr:transmembrane protein 106B-like [Denticeps clupeoides]XP_028844723.1 transmembrane protein 106B-like [Denticeps clupeoides]